MNLILSSLGFSHQVKKKEYNNISFAAIVREVLELETFLRPQTERLEVIFSLYLSLMKKSYNNMVEETLKSPWITGKRLN